MSTTSLPQIYRDRLRLFAALLAGVSIVGAGLRVILYVEFHDGGFDFLALALTLGAGFVFDLLAGTLLFAPLVLALASLRLSLLRRRSILVPALALVFALVCFNATTEYYFFEEFNSRYNHIALDYVLFPAEVIGNIQESYNVPLHVGLALLGGVLLALGAQRYLRDASFGPLPWSARWRGFLGVLVALALALAVAGWMPSSLTENRITNEIAQNGFTQLVRAFRTAQLDYPLFYATLPRGEGRARAARVLGADEPSSAMLAAPEERFELQRDFVPGERRESRPLDAVILLEESLGSEFVSSLGGTKNAACPELERWAKDGLLLTNLTANGNRTVRGLEGVLCSFVPLPGDSIVKRDRSENVASLARVFRAGGYSTEFFYGGRGAFDDLASFMLANGYQRLIEQHDFPSEEFHTIWGVADEFVLDRMLARQLEAQQRGERFFGTLLTVSNHKPYAVPEGRPGGPPAPRKRVSAVRYADYCIGRYLDQAREAGLLEHTVVLVVGDHGARVYGAEQIPTPSYRIPGLFVAPDPAHRGQKLDRLCSQIDLAPTLLSLVGLETRAPFLGQDLLGLPSDGGRAFLYHNLDVGMLTDRSLVVLGLHQSVSFYTRSGRDSDTLHRVAPNEITPELLQLQDDAKAVYQTAYELYENRRYRLPEP